MQAKRYVSRLSDLLGWLPVAIVASIVVWSAFRPYAPGGQSLVVLLMELMFLGCYAFAAVGITRILWRGVRMELSEEQKADYWRRIMGHPHGPLVVFVVSTGFVTCVFISLLLFFWPQR